MSALPVPDEQGIVRALMQALALRSDCFVWRNNTGAVTAASVRRWLNSNTAGESWSLGVYGYGLTPSRVR